MNKTFTTHFFVVCCILCFPATAAFSKTGDPVFKELPRRHQNAHKNSGLLFAGSGVPSISYSTPQSYVKGTAISALSPTNTGGAVPATLYKQVSTFAGSGTAGASNGTGTAATFKTPLATATDASGNVYVADYGNNVIRKISPAGVVTTLAGSGTAGSTNGTGTAASFNAPSGITADASGNVYVADGANNQIRKITSSGVVTTFAGTTTAGATNGTGTGARFSNPHGLTTDANGNIYVADYGNNLIRKITTAGVVTTFAGSGTAGAANGTGTAASFSSPYGITADNSGNIYVAETGNNLIRKITSAGAVSTFAGSGTAGSTNGTGTAAAFHSPSGVAADPAGNIYVTDVSNNQIRKITSAGVVSTFAGSGAGTAGTANGNGTSAAFSAPKGISIDANGNLYIADYTNNLIRKIITYGYNISASLPAGLAFDQTTGTISGTPTAASAATNYTIAAYNSSGSGNTIISIAVTAPLTAPSISYATPQTYATGTAISALSPTNTGGAVPATLYKQVSTFAGSGTAGASNGTGTAATFKTPLATATDASGNVYVADYGNNVIRKISPAGVVTTLAGSGTAGSTNGTGTAASFSAPSGITADASGNVYVSDGANNQIRKITSSGVVTTFAGTTTAGATNGTGTGARFSNPHGLTTDANGNIYVADYGNNLIRKITTAGVVTTFAGSGTAGAANGTGTAASFSSPYGITADNSGNIYVAETGNNLIRKITSAGAVSTFAGSGTAGSTNGTGTAASFHAPSGLAADPAGNVYVTDVSNNQIRKITSAGVVSTFAGSGAGTAGTANGNGTSAAFSAPKGISIDANGNLYIADYTNNLIRKIITYGYNISASLPAGLTFDQTTGTISGTPTAASAATNYTIAAYNAAGSSSAVLNITITNPAVTAPSISYSATTKTYTLTTPIATLTPSNSGGAITATYGQVTTFAGNGKAGFANGTGTAASFSYPYGSAVDATGNIYIADAGNGLIRKITPAGAVTTFAGSGTFATVDGTGTAASFNQPVGIVIDPSGNLFVTENVGNVIRKITPAGVVTTFAGSGTSGFINGAGTAASFAGPVGIVMDGTGNLYVTELSNYAIRKITPAGSVTTFAGGTNGEADGTGTAASFTSPFGITIDNAGNLYVAENVGARIRKITPSAVVTTFAGGAVSNNSSTTDGVGTAINFGQLSGIAIDNKGILYFADVSNNLIRAVTLAGVVTTVAGAPVAFSSPNIHDGTGAGATFGTPVLLSVDNAGNLFVPEIFDHKIRKVAVNGYSVSPALPAGLKLDPSTGAITGTPTVLSGAQNYTISGSNTAGVSTATISIAVINPATAPQIKYTAPAAYTVGLKISPLSPANSGGAVPATIYGKVSNFAGTGTAGNADGVDSTATFNTPYGSVTDANGNIFVADSKNNVIREITALGAVSTFAGSGTAGSTDGTGTGTAFSNPEGITIDAGGNLYVTDQANNTIRKITPAGVVSTFAGVAGSSGFGNGSTATFNNPAAITIDAAGNLYVADVNNNAIRKITPAGVTSTFAGSGTAGLVNGTGTGAQFNSPSGIAADASGNIFVADASNQVIRKITAAGVVTTFAGSTLGYADGAASSAQFNLPSGVAVDGSTVYVADYNNNRIRSISNGTVSTIAGNNQDTTVNNTGVLASFDQPVNLSRDAYGNLYVTDNTSNEVRKIITRGYSISQALPAGLSFDATTGIISGNPAVVSSNTYTVTAYNAAGSSTTTVAIKVNNPTSVPNIALSATSKVYTVGTPVATVNVTNSGGPVPPTPFAQVVTIAGTGVSGSLNGPALSATFAGPAATVQDAAGNIYVADDAANLIRKISTSGDVSTFAGNGAGANVDGVGTAASFTQPSGITIDASGNLYVVDIGDSRIRKITPNGVVTTIAGTGTAGYADGIATNASFSAPYGIAIDASGNLYVTDSGNSAIRKIDASGTVTTFAGGTAGSTDGTGTAASFNTPIGITVAASGNLYVTDASNNTIRKITTAGVVTTIAGSPGNVGSADGTGASATFRTPAGIVTDQSGNIFVSDAYNGLLRKITSAGVVTTIAGDGRLVYKDGIGPASSLTYSIGLIIDASGNLYFSDFFAKAIRKISTRGYGVSPALPAGLTFDGVAGTITGTPTRATGATDYAVTAYNAAGISSKTINITVNNPPAPNIAYAGPYNFPLFATIAPITPTNSGGVVPAVPFGQVTTMYGFGKAGTTDGTGKNITFNNPVALTVGADGTLFIADAGNHEVRSISPNGVSASSSSHNGTLISPSSLLSDQDGNLFFTDGGKNTIFEIPENFNGIGGEVLAVAGSATAGNSSGYGTAASFNNPSGIAMDILGNIIVSDAGNNEIRFISNSGDVSTYLGTGTAGNANGSSSTATFNAPAQITLVSNNLYIADRANNLIRKYASGTVTTFAGSGTAGTQDGTGTAANINNPSGIASDKKGNLFVTENTNHGTVRMITPSGVVTTLAGNINGFSYGDANNGYGDRTSFSNPLGIAVDLDGNVIMSDLTDNSTGANNINKISTHGYTISPSTLPSGLTFNYTTGIISGLPNVNTAAVNFTITAYNVGGSSSAVISISTGTQTQALAKQNTMANALFKTDTVINAEPKVRPTLSPNGDGINDALTIENIQQYPSNKMLIVDNNGSKIYEVTGYDNDTKRFDGHASTNGRMQKPGTYFYVLEYRSKMGLKRKTGYFIFKY